MAAVPDTAVRRGRRSGNGEGHGRAAGQEGGTAPSRRVRKELYRLQAELVKMQEWMRVEGARIVVIFEGRDAAGKGSTIKRVAEYLNPRVARIVALPAPTERERSEWYFQRYVSHLPAAGELALSTGAGTTAAGVEHVMGFCTKEESAASCTSAPSSSGCWPRRASCSANTGSRSATMGGSAGQVTARRSDAPVEAVPDGF